VPSQGLGVTASLDGAMGGEASLMFARVDADARELAWGLFAYSEWLDAQKLVRGELEADDKRTHEDLVTAFLQRRNERSAAAAEPLPVPPGLPAARPIASSANPWDILIAGSLHEARSKHRQFGEREAYSVDRPARLEGRRFRRAYATATALASPNWHKVEAILGNSSVLQGLGQLKVMPVEHWVPEEPSVMERIQRLPELNASASRDFGRGYAKAVRDVIALLAAEALAAA
jgi:hypothetical protein